MYDPKEWSWGTELEWGDVRKDLPLPSHLGSWDWSEVGIVNLRPPYAGKAVDPQGKEPPVGGEINVRPTMTPEGQVEKIKLLMEFFNDNGCPPTVSAVNGLHFHTFVPGLIDDVEALKRVVAYNQKHQRQYSDAVYGFWKDPNMKRVPGATQRLGNRTVSMPDWMSENIIEKAASFEDFIRLQCCGKDGVSRGRPIRYHINLYNMKKIGTIEWRSPCATLDLTEIHDLIKLTESYLEAALNDGPPFSEILNSREWKLPQFRFVSSEFESWKNTKYPDERGEKSRVFIPQSELTE